MSTRAKNSIYSLFLTFFLSSLWLCSGHHRHWLPVILLGLSTLPFTKGGNVYSLWGGFSDKNITSPLGLFQQAERDATSWVGICFYQSAGRDAVQHIGFSFYMHAMNDAVQLAGIIFCQLSEKNAGQMVGIVFYQKANFIGNNMGSFTAISRGIPSDDASIYFYEDD